MVVLEAMSTWLGCGREQSELLRHMLLIFNTASNAFIVENPLNAQAIAHAVVDLSAAFGLTKIIQPRPSSLPINMSGLMWRLPTKSYLKN
jgi:hypothetical protein